MVLRWPADFPEDCPPEEAQTANGVYYYIVKSDPPEPSDFVSLYHRNRRLADRRIKRGASQCQTMGLSVFTLENDAVQCAIHNTRIGDRIARLVLGPDAGKVLPTPGGFESHHTWWHPEGYDPTAAATDVTAL